MYPQLQAIGREITQVVKPKAVVVVSAHWESSIPGVVEINGGEGETELIYEYVLFLLTIPAASGLVFSLCDDREDFRRGCF